VRFCIKKPINDVIPNQDIKVSLYMLNLLKKTNNLPSPQLTIQLVKGTTVIASQIMPSIPRDEQWHSSTDLAGVLLTLNPGNNTSLDFQIISNSQVVSGNDLAVDDILVYQIPKSCIAQKDVPIVIDSNKAFSGSITGFKDLTCSGSNNGEITIAAQNFNLPYGFDYSLDDGATWINSKVSPVTATGLTNKTYLVRIRFDAAGSSCVFPFTQVIKSPSALTVTAQVTAQPTCANGASITATANGGTPNYQYELRQSNGTTVVVAFQNSNIFTNVATGSYTIVVRDANSCASPASARVDINAPTAPTASLSASSDICYDTINQSTLIVTATGAGTLSYSLDGQPAQNSNTFTNVGPGTHNIVVTDSNNCIATVSNIVIAPELKGSATVSKTLDCTGSPDATISVTISGGTSAFTYKVKKGAGVYGSSINVTGTSFVYTANSADTYTFEITDSKGCINIVSAIVNPIVNPTVTGTKVDATCNGASTGSVQLIGSGGSGGYTYLFYNNTTTPLPTTFVGQSNYTGLAAGTYSYQVMDSKGCKSAVGSITITQPTNLTATATATTFTCDSSNVKQAATVTIAVPTTGTAPYQYSFDGGTTFTGTRTLSVTDNGTNQVISYVVSDAQGCKTPVQTITINRLNPPTNLTFSAANVTCTATTTTVTATATNGVGTLTYSITAPAASVASNTTGVFSGLIAGTYNFRVTDANGCYFEKPFTINAVTPIAVVGNKTTDVLCKGGSTGSGAYTVSGNAVVGGYTFTLTAGTLGTGTLTKSGNTLTLSNVAAGTYTVQVTDSATGCTNTASIVIAEPAVGLTIASATATNVSCNDDNSLITVTANGGTPNYTYAYAKNPSVAPTSTYASSNVLTVDTNSGADVAWDVYVKDTNGCTSKSTVNVLLDAMPAVTNVTVNNQCTASGSGFTITVTATGLAPLSYGINGPTGAFQPSNTFTVAAGTYTVYVKDKNGCIVSAPAATIVYPQLTAVGTVTKELDCSATPNATITVTIGGGKGPFTYTVKKGAGAPGAASASIAGPTFTYSVTPANADTYTFAVTDANGCTKSAIVVVDPISNPTVTAAQTNAGCNGLSDGSVTLTGTGGSGGFTYSNNATTGFTANPTFTGLAAGSYTFYVKDSKGCSGSVAVVITQPTTLAATVSTVPFTCNTTSNAKVAGTVTVNVTAGTGTAPYEYSFNGSGYSANNVLTLNDNGADQPYTYSVRDAKGCPVAGSGTLLRLNPPTDLTFVSPSVTCTATTTTVTLTAVNGVGTLQYETIAPSPVIIGKQSSNAFANLAPGIYMFRVTDANGCYYTESYTVNPVTPIAVVGNKTTDVLCKGGSTGSGAYTVSGNAVVGGYTFTLTAGTLGTGTLTKSGNTLTLSNVAAGTYTVQVTDSATGCTNTASIVIAEPAVGLTIASATATNVSCNDDNSLITVTANGGTPNYTYAYAKNPSVAPTSTYASSNVLTVDTNSGADVAWDVYVKDTNGCTSKSTVNVLLDAMPAVTNVTVNNQCTASGSGFTITVTATGLAPLSYGINGPTGAFQPSNTFTVAAGTYTVYVKDKNGCIVSAPAATIVYPQLTAVGTVTKELDCSATPNATITVTIGGGKGPFTYTVKKGAGAPGAASASIAGPTFTYSVTPANADTYTFAVTDANGCTKSAIVVVDPISNPTVTAAQTNAGCNGLSDGSVTLTGTGGSGGFTYSNNATTGFTANPTFTGLAAGSYTFYVKDSKGCSGSVAVVITQPTTLAATVSTVPFTCNTTSNAKVAGTVTVNVTAGTGTAPYEYSFNGSGYSANNVLTLNDNGADQPYTYSVRDAKGCPVAGSGTLLRLNPPTDLTFVSPSVTCTATTTTVTLTAVNGVGTLQYETIAPSPVIIGKQSSNAFANLAPGIYMFRVTDANGCYYTESYTVNPVTPIAVVGNKTTDVLCKGGSTGSGAYTVSGNAVVGGYTFTLTAGTLGTGTLTKSGNTLTLSNVAAGTYTVQVTDSATGCTNTASIVIAEPAVALSATYAAVNANCLTSTSEVTVTATGGTPVYKYSFVQDGAAVGVYSNNNKANLDPTVNVNWDVYVTDANGCTFKLDLVIAKDLVPTVTASVLNQCSASGNTFQIRAVGASGVGPYTYTINTGVAPSPADTFTVAAGTYTITVKDANGCTNTTIVTVNQALTASAIVTKDITCANPQEATINFSILGGKTPFGYRVNINGGGFSGSPIAFGGSSFTYTATALTGATYQFEITDANGTPCTALTNSVNTNTAGSVTASYAKVDPTCNGFTDGSIKLTATAGVSPFVYSIDNGVTFSSSNVFGGLTAGTYNYIVKDSKGCESVPAIITLTNPAPIVVNIVRNAIQCNTNTPGSFDVNVISGGTAPYVYKLYDNAFTEIATYTEASSLPTPVYSFGGLNFGDYYITVVDAKGCEYNSGKLRIETPPYLAMTGVADSNNCATGVDVTVTTSGGTGPYRYSIFGQPLTETAPLASNVYTFVGLSHGITYFLQVKDSYNCISILEFKTPDPPSTIKITGTATTNVTCNGTSNGTLDFTVQDYDLSVTNIQYEVLNALTLLPLTTPINGVLTGAAGGPVNGNITTLPAGNYVLKVTEVGGTECSTAFTFTITQPGQPLVSTVTSVVNANCNSGALVTLTTTGGTGPYTYAAAAGSVPTTFIAGNVLNLDYNLGNNWNIIVKDANGCTFPLTQSIIKDPSPVIALSIVDKCVAEGTFGINVTETTAGTGTYSISVDNSTYASILGLPYNISGLNSGSHTIAVKDANGCIDTKSIIIAEPLQLVPAINALPTCANNDGQITLTGTGGTGAGTYSYSISPVAGSIAGNVISGLPAGTYTVTMTDTAIPTNCSTTASVTLIAPTPVTFTTVTTDVTCNGDTDGIITVNLGAGNDNPNYTYEITAGPAIRPAQSSNLFTGLAAGTYTVKVNSGRGCDSDDTNVVVGSPLVLKASSDLTTALTCTAGNVATKALVTITATDGTAPYLYSFDGGVTYTSTNTYEAFVGTTFDVFVKDAKGCLLTLTNGVNIPGLNPPTNMDISGTPIWCAPAANTTSTVTISNVINGVGALQYEILSPIVVAKQSGAAFAGLTPDTYLFQVTDANGCTYQESYTINPVTNITISGQLVNDVTCNGKTDGAVKFTVANYAGAYTAVLTAGTGTLTQTGNTVDVTGLVPGTYTVEVKDNITGCIASTSVVVSEPTVLDIAIDSNINANCNFGAKVAVIATGGTPNYTYAFVQDGATPLAGDYTNTANAVLDPLVNTQWDVYVKDARGCTDIVDVTIGTDALPTINPSAGLYCYTGGPVPITITGTYVGTPTYSIGNGYQSSPNFVLNAPGNYTFYIKDGNGCIVSSPYTLNQELLLQASLTQDLTCAGSATITLLATQGTTTYAGFEVDINGGGYNAATSPYTAVAAGTYTFRVTDSQGCQSVSIPVTVTPNTTPTATFTKTNVSCIGGNDGSIIVTAADGILPYQYSINSGAFQPSNIFTGLTAGTYDIVVKDAKECTSVIVQATITEPTALAALASLTQGLSCGTGNSTQPAIVTVDVTPGTGTAPYQYSFNGGTNYSSTNTFTTSTAGLVTAYVKDANNCIIAVPVSVNIPGLNPPTNMDISGTPIWCAPAANTTSTVTISNVINGVGALQYEILSPIVVAKQSGAAFAGLTPDTYLFQVTDANGCTYQESYTINPVTNITISGQLVNDVTCNGKTDGAVKFTVANYAGAYTAVLTAGTGTLTQTGNTVDVTGLVPGTYTVEVKDNITGCIASTSVVVSEPTVLDIAIDSNINANCNFGAKVAVIATGGTPNYTYAFVQDGATPLAGDYTNTANAVLDPLVNTQWDVYVKDARGCTDIVDVTIGTDALPTINPSAGLYCYTGGPVPITITGTYVGTPTYSIGNGYQSSPNFVLNAPGNYTFYIKDGNGCIVSSPYTLNQELLLQASLAQDLTCAGSATITLLATQGTTTYAGFEVDINGGGYNAATSPYTAVAAGTYTFRVTDSQGCQSVSIPVTVTPNTTPTATFTKTNVSCIGGNDGSIIVTAADGILPYQYSINSGAFQPSNIFAGLTAGTYDIVVKDAKECTSVIVQATITEPTALAALASLTQGLSCGTGNSTQPAIVTVDVTPGTGTAPYQYSFNGGTNYSSTNTFTTSTAGLVTAYVKDANNCIIAVPVSVNIPAIDPPTIDNIIGTPIWCAPAANTASTVTVTVSHGVGTLNYEILSPASAVTNTSGASNGVFTMLAADTYLFQVTDANGCKDEAYYTVDPLINITTTGQLVNDVSCNGGSDGSVKFDVDNFTGTYTAALIGGPVTGTLTQTGKVVTLTNLPVGNYIVQVKDEITGCIATASVVVSQPSLLTLTQTANVNANCNSGAQVSVSAAGGTPDYKYAFVVDTATPTATDYTNSNNAVLNPGTSLNWKAYVVDSKGCETFIPITITLDPVPSAITAIVANQCPSATGDYTFTVNVGSGVAPYEYNIGKGFQLSPTFTVTSGTYDVTVKDANGCETTVNAAVTIAPALQLDATLTALPSCTINNGIITATATGGSGAANYNYTLDGGVIVTTTPAVFNNVAPGTHIVRVRDVVTTCTYDVTVEIAPATIITGLTLDGSDVSCKGSSDGSITAVLAPNGAGVNDNPVYTYTLTGTTVLGVAVNRPAQTLNIFENLEAGDYTVTVTSGRGCVDSEDIRIKEPAVIVVNAPVIVQYGCASGTNTSNYATITVNSVTGGSGNYIIYEFLKNGVVVQKGAENVYNESDFLGGNYLVNVYDDNGCMGSTVGTVTVNPYINLDAVNVAVSNAITCISNEDITVTVTTTGGTPVLLNYTVTGTNGNTYNQTNTNGNFTGLTIGDYLITVSNPATGCSIEKIHYVNDPNTFEIKVTPVNGKICFGTTDGSVDLTFVDNQLVPTNDAGAFDYTITGPLTINGTTTNAGPFNIPNLVAGQYTVVAKLVNKPECTVTTVFNIEQPSAVLTVATTQSEITCVTGNNDGVISASAAGGWNTTNYQYQLVLGGNVLVDYSNQAVFNGLSAGVYTINAKDSNDCIATTTATLVVPDPIVITTSPDVLLTCFGAKNGTITVTNVTGGQGSNYLYTLNIVSATPVIVSGPQTSPVFTGLGTGTYSITVTDGYNCTATSGTIVISEPTEVIPSLVVSKTQTCLTQTTLTLSAVGGTSPYTYSADANFATVIGSFASSTSFDVPAGNYHYYVKDANDCVSFISNDIKIEPIEPLIVNLELSNAVVKCTGSATGVIVANSTGGLGGYQYTLLNGAGTTILAGPQAEDRFENLIADTYTVKVDSGDCSDTESVIIKQPDTPFTAFATPTPVMCFGDKSGKIVVTASGGTGAYVYSISPRSDQYFDDGIFENLAVGSYTILANDENGCQFMEVVEVTGPASPLQVSVTPGSILPEQCIGELNGSFTIDITGGKAPYKVSLDDKKGTYVDVTTMPHVFENLKGGLHNVYVIDANGCTFDLESVSVPLPVDLTSTVKVEYGCETNTVTVDVIDTTVNPADLDYALDNESGTYQSENVFKDVLPGDHVIYVRHTNGCSIQTPGFKIDSFDKLTVKVVSAGVTEMNVIEVIGVGGKSPYEYSFNGEPFTSSNKYNIYKSGDYEVIVRDQNGCTATIIVPMIYVDVCIPNYFTPNGDGLYDGWGPGCTNIYNNLEFSIFDRYGRIIAKYHYGEKWDGKYNGEELPTGDYWYVLKLNDEKDAREFVGHFTLYR
jgi:gliding motility-associated-like protein